MHGTHLEQDAHRYPPLAWTRDGQPFHPAPSCAGWRVFRVMGRGRPALVFRGDGPLHLDMQCDFPALREAAGPGSYALHQVDATGTDIAETPAAYVTIPEPTPEPNPERDYINLALRTQGQMLELLRDLLKELIHGTSNMQKATAELLSSGTDAVSIASGAGLPDHIAGLLTQGGQDKNNLEVLLNSPVVVSTLAGLTKALQQGMQQEKTT